VNRKLRLKSAAVLAAALLIAACGGTSSTTSSSVRPGAFVRVYASLPNAGPGAAEATEMADGIELALAEHHRRAGDYPVRYVTLNAGSAAKSFAFVPSSVRRAQSAVADNARRAAADPSAVLYLGELGSDANRISIPMLNLAGMPQLSPTSTAVGLTAAGPGSARGEPLIYFPRRSRTFVRLLPNDAAQAEASLLAFGNAHCARIALAHDRRGASLAKLIRADAPLHGLTVAGSAAVTGTAAGLQFLSLVRTSRADCVGIEGTATPALAQLTNRVHATAPAVHLFLGSDGMCVPGWTNALDGGVDPALDRLLLCTRPTLPLDAYPGGAAFRHAYQAAFGGATPDVYALLGYTAMQVGLDAIASLGRRGNERSAVLAALLRRIHHTPLGTFSFDRLGDTTLDVYGLYRVGGAGNPVLVTTLHPRAGA
jgi:branched-chain amino acid transport system substrate-binding protein